METTLTLICLAIVLSVSPDQTILQILSIPPGITSKSFILLLLLLLLLIRKH